MKFSFKPAFTAKSKLEWRVIQHVDRSEAPYVTEAYDITIEDGFSKESENSSISEISESLSVGANAGYSGVFFSGGVEVNYTTS